MLDKSNYIKTEYLFRRIIQFEFRLKIIEREVETKV